MRALSSTLLASLLAASVHAASVQAPAQLAAQASGDARSHSFCAACESCYSTGSATEPLEECLAGQCESNSNWSSPSDHTDFCWDLKANQAQRGSSTALFFSCYKANATHAAPCTHASSSAAVSLASSGAPQEAPIPFTLPGQKETPNEIEVSGASAVTEGCGGVCAGKGCPAGWRAVGDRIYSKKGESEAVQKITADATGKQHCKCICIQ